MTHYRKGLWRSQEMVLRSVEGYESDKHEKSFRASPVCFYIAQRLHSTTTTQISTMSTMSWISVVEKNNRTEGSDCCNTSFEFEDWYTLHLMQNKHERSSPGKRITIMTLQSIKED